MGINVITVSGSPGSGKTTYAKHIAEKLGYRFVSAGNIFRKVAEELGVSVVELNKMASKNENIDRLIESRIIEEARRGKVVVEGHLVSWTLYGLSDLRIYLTAPLGIRLMRIAKREGKDLVTVAKETLEREYYEATRYRRLYGVDISNLSIFHLIIDTSLSDVEDMKRIILENVSSFLRLKE